TSKTTARITPELAESRSQDSWGWGRGGAPRAPSPLSTTETAAQSREQVPWRLESPEWTEEGPGAKTDLSRGILVPLPPSPLAFQGPQGQRVLMAESLRRPPLPEQSQEQVLEPGNRWGSLCQV
ncbi:hypothetical protein H1C71_041684, partial [Ictidomys tridecemlineatus]